MASTNAPTRDPKVQRNILDILSNARQQHQLPLIFLIASRPEQNISLAFNTGLLPSIMTRLALDESYLPNEDIQLFLADKFQEIKTSHPRRAYISPQWPLPDVLTQLVYKSSGQFIYASTVMKYISSIRHKPMDRLDIALGIRSPQRELPFAELDALYTHILASVEDVERVLEVLSVMFLFHPHLQIQNLLEIEGILSWQHGDAELYLGDLSSIANIEWNTIRVLHASFTDFLWDPTRSTEFWINPRARHTVFARQCLQSFQLDGKSDDYSFHNSPILINKKDMSK